MSEAVELTIRELSAEIAQRQDAISALRRLCPVTALAKGELSAAPTARNGNGSLKYDAMHVTDERMQKLCEVVRVKFGLVAAGALFEKTRKMYIVLPRQVAIYLARRVLKRRGEDVADYFGMERTSVIHSVESVEARRDTDKEFAAKLEELTKLI